MDFDLITRNFDPSATEEDRRLLQRWLEENPSGRIELEKLRKIWDESGNLGSFRSIDPESDWLAVASQVSKSFRTRHKRISFVAYIGRIAAIILLTFGLTFGVFKLIQTSNVRSTTFIEVESLDQVKTISLPDGSTVSLNINSTLRYRNNFNRNSRDVILEGEAFFEVIPDPTHPFRVLAKNSIIEVTGTVFSVCEDTAYVRVGVLSGSVYLKSSENPSIGTLVTQNESGLIYTDNTLEKQANVNPNIISWKTGQLMFHQTPVENALQDIARHFHKDLQIEITINDSLTAQYTNQPLEEILDELSLLTSLSITQSDNIIVVKQ